jgi:hypothetical protein
MLIIEYYVDFICNIFSLTTVTLAYVTQHDLRSISSLSEHTVIAIKAPPETRLEVPDPSQVCIVFCVINLIFGHPQEIEHLF